MSNKATKEEQDFGVAMQQLSAEAEKIMPVFPVEEKNSSADSHESAEPPAKSDAFAERLHGLENSVLNRLEQIAAQMEESRAAAFAEQFRRIDEQLASIRNTESVNQQLFDSLHAELIKHRDNFVHESPQKPFIPDLVYLSHHRTRLSVHSSSDAVT